MSPLKASRYVDESRSRWSSRGIRRSIDVGRSVSCGDRTQGRFWIVACRHREIEQALMLGEGGSRVRQSCIRQAAGGVNDLQERGASLLIRTDRDAIGLGRAVEKRGFQRRDVRHDAL